MHQSPGFWDPHRPNHVCLLQRSIYSLNQAPSAWFHRFVAYIISVGFCHSYCHSSLFIYKHVTDTAFICLQTHLYLLLYVDYQ